MEVLNGLMGESMLATVFASTVLNSRRLTDAHYYGSTRFYDCEWKQYSWCSSTLGGWIERKVTMMMMRENVDMRSSACCVVYSRFTNFTNMLLYFESYYALHKHVQLSRWEQMKFSPKFG